MSPRSQGTGVLLACPTTMGCWGHHRVATPLPGGWFCRCHPSAGRRAGMPELTCPLLLAAPQLLPGAEFSPALSVLLAGEVGGLGKGQRETPPCPSPGWQGGGGGRRAPAHQPADAVGDRLLPGGDDLLRVVLDEELGALPRLQLQEPGGAAVRARATGLPTEWPQPPSFGGQVVAENRAQLMTQMPPSIAVCRRARAAGNLLSVRSPRGKTPPGGGMSLGDLSHREGTVASSAACPLCSQPRDDPHRPHHH